MPADLQPFARASPIHRVAGAGRRIGSTREALVVALAFEDSHFPSSVRAGGGST
jgi:hypothetical protein